MWVGDLYVAALRVRHIKIKVLQVIQQYKLLPTYCVPVVCVTLAFGHQVGVCLSSFDTHFLCSEGFVLVAPG